MTRSWQEMHILSLSTALYLCLCLQACRLPTLASWLHWPQARSPWLSAKRLWSSAGVACALLQVFCVYIFEWIPFTIYKCTTFLQRRFSPFVPTLQKYVPFDTHVIIICVVLCNVSVYVRFYVRYFDYEQQYESVKMFWLRLCVCDN